MKKSQRGFSLIEILVVMGLIAVLAAIVIIAINPARQFAQGRNAQRESDVNAIMNAIGQNVADNKGISTCTGITTATSSIGTTGVNLAACLVPAYMTAIPKDPTDGTEADTKYEIVQEATKRYTICAPEHAEAALGATAAVFCITR